MIYSEQDHRLAKPVTARIDSFFPRNRSVLQELEDRFPGHNPAIIRCFSLACHLGATAYVEETIAPEGMIALENEDLERAGYWHGDMVLRFSFWRVTGNAAISVDAIDSSCCLGYALIKCDGENSEAPRFYVFEAVFNESRLTYTPSVSEGEYDFRVLNRVFRVRGTLYCQQNGLTKVCSQVALRSLLSRLMPGHDISYRRIEDLAKEVSEGKAREKIGLTTTLTEKIIKRLGFTVDYMGMSIKTSESEYLRYLHLIYAGVESGAGSFMAFGPKGLASEPDKLHVIPVYGHSFNDHNWVAGASSIYFDESKMKSSVSSDAWLGSFVGHDDNCGPCLMIPRHYLHAGKLAWGAVLRRPHANFSSASAKKRAWLILCNCANRFFGRSENAWARQIRAIIGGRCGNGGKYVHKIVLRVSLVDRFDYLKHIALAEDWDGNMEDEGVIADLSNMLPEKIWLGEFSVVPLFSGFKRVLGEVVLDAATTPDTDKFSGEYDIDYSSSNIFENFCFLRFPSAIITRESLKASSEAQLKESNIQSHVSCYEPFHDKTSFHVVEIKEPGFCTDDSAKAGA